MDVVKTTCGIARFSRRMGRSGRRMGYAIRSGPVYRQPFNPLEDQMMELNKTAMSAKNPFTRKEIA